MNEGSSGGIQAPGPGQDQIWGSVFNDPTAPFWDGPTAPAPTPRAPNVPPAPLQEPPPVPPERPVPPVPPAPDRRTGAAYRNRNAESRPTSEDHRPTGRAYRNRGTENRSTSEESRRTGAAYRNRRQRAAAQGFPPAGSSMSNRYAQQGPVQQHARPLDQYGQSPDKTLFSANTWTILTILNLLGPGRPSFDSLVFDFMHINKSSRDPRSSHALTKVAWVVFTVASITGTVRFLIHAIFPF